MNLPKHKRTYVVPVLVVIAAVSMVLVGWGAWTAGMKAGMDMTAAPGTPQGSAAGSAAALGQDPSNWSIAEGEEATRRHIRDGLKAGDLDSAVGRTIMNYHDPMVPGKNFDAPAKSPFMDMMLVPRYAGASADAGSVTVSPRMQQNLGLKTAPVVLGSLAGRVSAVGNVAWNEREQVVVSARANGFVERLYVRAVLDRVAAGAPLAEIYVPDWIAAQEDYLALARMAGTDLAPLREAARQRMRQAGMSPAQIERVARTRQLEQRFTLTAPRAGTLTELALREGSTVMAGAELARIQGTDTVWAEGQLPESQAALVKPGTRVTATSPAAPGQTFEGRVQTLLPGVDPVTRTLKARMELSNAAGQLVPGMLVSMQFALPAEAARLLVPSDAVIHTGQRSVVMLAEGEGRFTPAEVKVGREAGEQTEILEGLQEGQQVVLSGQFLIDSEASLRGLLARLGTAAAAQVHRTEAVVDAVTDDTVTLTHPPIASLKWPQMQMDFRLPAGKARSGALKAGDTVSIEFSMQQGDVPQITSIEPRRAGSKP
jgi:Cu(I)/Ag(I) efflux system membrane fusion protein